MTRLRRALLLIVVGLLGYGIAWAQPFVFRPALVPGQDLGIALVWNSDSSLPSGLLPTILDRAMGLPGQPWVETPADYDLLLAESPETMPANGSKDSGTSSQRSTASPR